jgi:hypothetical protein
VLSRVLPDGRRARHVRTAQVVLGLVAAYAALQWVEHDPAPVEAGRESLRLSLSAPVESPRGPWQAGMAFTESGPGIPPDVAPNATLTARYLASGLEPRDAAWSARLSIEEVQDGEAWWRVERVLPVEARADDPRVADVRLPLAAIAEEARALEASAAVPGILTVRVEVRHEATVHHRGNDVVAERTAVLRIGSSEGALLVQAEPDEGVYRSYPAKPLPSSAIAAGAAVLGLEAALALARRDWPAWTRLPNAHHVAVQGLAVPPAAAWTGLDALMRAARRAQATILVDPDAGVAVLPGPVPLAARLAAEPAAAPVEAPLREAVDGHAPGARTPAATGDAHPASQPFAGPSNPAG